MREVVCLPSTGAGGGQPEPFGSEGEGRRALDGLLTAMAGLGYSVGAMARVRNALQPALATALRYALAAPGGRGVFRYRAGQDFAVAEVEGWAPGRAGPNGEPFRVWSYTRVRCDRRGGRLSVWGSLSAP